MSKNANREPRDADEASAQDEPTSVLRLETRRVERRIPGLGVVGFRAPSAGAEETLQPFYAEGTDARAFANALIAICIEEPTLTGADVETWSERARAIARVTAAQTLGCFAAYRRLAGSDLDGDERLLAAMRQRNEDLHARLRAATAALSANVGAGVVRMFETSALFKPTAIERMFAQQRQLDRLLRPSYLNDLTRLSKQFEALRPTYLERLSKLYTVNPISAHLTNSALFGSRLFGTAGALHTVGVGRSPQFAQLEQLKKIGQSFAPPNSFGARLAADSGISRLFARPSYFGALRGQGRSPFPDYSVVAARAIAQFYPRPATQFDALTRMIESFRERLASPLRAYVEWLEREWAAAKAQHKPAPVLFVLASLPALVGLQLLDALVLDDEPLLAGLEGELSTGALAGELQTSLQHSTLLDSVAKRNLVTAIEHIAAAQYVDAAPPLYHGLERAFRLTARSRGVIDGNNCFLNVGAHRRRMRTIEDTFRYLGLDHLYLRFLHAWVFGEIGNLARHGDLPEAEHRQWVLRAVVALVGWLEYVGGKPNAVAELVERLELEPHGASEVETA